MDPSLVLNDDQKRARFRKMHEKKPQSSAGTLLSGPVMVNISASSSVGHGDLKLHSMDSRFGGQIRRSKTLDSTGPPLQHVAREAFRARKFSGQGHSSIPNLIITSSNNQEPQNPQGRVACFEDCFCGQRGIWLQSFSDARRLFSCSGKVMLMHAFSEITESRIRLKKAHATEKSINLPRAQK